MGEETRETNSNYSITSPNWRLDKMVNGHIVAIIPSKWLVDELGLDHVG